MQIIFVAGVDTNIGKTYTSSHLTLALQEQNHKAITIKPIETGVQSLPQDSLLHLHNAQNLFPHFTLSNINLYSLPLPASPFVADIHQSITLENLDFFIQCFEDKVEILLIEGAGGLFVPILQDFFMIDWIVRLQKSYPTQTLLVCDDKLGMINRFLSAKTLLDLYKIPHHIFVNLLDSQSFQEVSYPFLKHYHFTTKIQDLVKVFYPKL